MPFVLKNLLVLGAMLAPGYLTVRVAQLKLRTISGLILSFILSLVANYLVMAAFVIAGVSPGASLRIAYGFAGLAAAALFVAHAVSQSPAAWKPRSVSFWVLLGYGLGIVLAGVSLNLAAADFQPIFTAWDAVVSYNRWAIDWSHFTASEITYGYPQLIPANLGLIYVLVGTPDHQLYGRMLYVVWAVMPTVLFLDLFRLYGTVRYLIASAAYCYVLTRLYPGASAGYMDLPVAVLGLAFVYLVWFTPYLRKHSSAQATVVIGVILSAVGLVKQAGLAAVGSFGVVQVALSGSWRARWLLVGVVTGLVGSWYIRAQIRMLSGADMNFLGYWLGDIHQGRDLRQRIVHGLSQLGDQFGYIALATAAASIAAAAIFDPRYRRTVLLVALYLPAWLLVWSYDTRNATIMLPIAVLGFGIASERLLFLLMRRRGAPGSVVRRGAIPVASSSVASLICVMGLVSAALAFSFRSEAELLDRERHLMSTTIGDAATNTYLRAAADAGEIGSFVLTNYLFLTAIPDFRPRQIEQESFFFVDRLARTLERHDETTIIEVRAYTFKPAQAWFAQQIEAGALTIVRENPWIRIMRYREKAH